MSATECKKIKEISTDKKLKEWAYIFQALGDKTRLDIIKKITYQPGVSAKEMLIDLKLSQPTLSFHLKHLQRSKLVFYKKVGTTHAYYMNADKIIEYHKSVKLACDFVYEQVIPALKKK